MKNGRVYWVAFVDDSKNIMSKWRWQFFKQALINCQMKLNNSVSILCN